jgi:hypothetical protein
MTTLFVSCPGAKSADDVFDTLNTIYGGNTPITAEIKFMHDKNGSAIAFITVVSGSSFRSTRMDRLIHQLKDKAAKGKFHTERLIYGKYEWGIKIAKPRDEHPTFEPKFR